MTPEQPNLSAERTCAEIARLHALNEREAELACALACMFDDSNDDVRTGICVHRPEHAQGTKGCAGRSYHRRRLDHSFGLRDRAPGRDAIGLSPCPTLFDGEIRRWTMDACRLGDEIRPHGR